MADLYPIVESFAGGSLDVGDGNHIHWEASGNPHGKPAVLFHGGPGQGSAPGMRRGFDPERYLVVMFDQRGCGRSTPHASDPATDMSLNTTGHLIADTERLREHLAIDRWLVCGGSWGSTLGLAYAQAHPERVTEIVLIAITTSRRSETDWLYRGLGMFFPEAFERFRAAVPEAREDRDLPAAYARRMESPDPAVRAAAARAWSEWEDTVLSLEPMARPGFGGPAGPDLDAIVRICAHYSMHGAWLEEGQLINDAGKLAGIPGVLIHGRRDLSCPAATAFELAAAWPDARLLIDDQTGHRGGPGIKREWLLSALDGFARE
ncbi:MAG TPA: prolyl aminopeptidase [Streptosporangiaceae bacterium]|nr:prolyl aminopeptidase [Streptosporangiaceae bacterium]